MSTESVVIEGAADKSRYRELAADLDLTVRADGLDLVIEGSDLHLYLARIDPDVWDPARARGDA